MFFLYFPAASLINRRCKGVTQRQWKWGQIFNLNTWALCQK